ncbi:MAG: ribokinase [Clostridia bacterium]|nr:ribokinase [Clostridia bacterium]
MNKPRILTVGSANIDLMARITKFPSVGQTVKEKSGYEYKPGGKGANAAYAVHRMGGESIFCAKLGNDTHGARLNSIYANSGMDTRFISQCSHERTGLAMVMVEPNGNNRIVVYPGANEYLGRGDVENAVLCYPDAILLGFEIPVETVIATAEFAKELDIPLIVDAGPAEKNFPLEYLGKVEVFSPNETETYIYTGIKPDTTDKCLKACMALLNRVDAKVIVLKLGSKGCYVFDGTYFYVMPAYSVDVQDTTAAGDVFTAAFAVEYMRNGKNFKRAAAYANMAGALCVTKDGAFESVPSHSDICDFVLKNEINYQL